MGRGLSARARIRLLMCIFGWGSLATAIDAFGYDIAGVVTDAETRAPLEGIRVDAFCGSCPPGSYAISFTDAAGEYRLAIPRGGRYRVRTENNLGFFDEVHADVRCPNARCEPPVGGSLTLVEVPSSDAGMARVDFDLVRYGTVRIVAVDATTGGMPRPLEGNTALRVWLSVDGNAPREAITQSVGRDRVELRLERGVYRIAVSSPLYTPTLYPSIACPDPCDFESGAAVVVEPGGNEQITVHLVPRYGTIRGRVTDAISGNPLSDVLVATVGGHYATDRTDAAGEYALDTLAGTARLRAAPGASHVDQGFLGVRCPASCIAGLTPFEVPVGSFTTIDFALERAGTIEGVVRRADRSPLAGASVEATSGSRAGRTISGAEGRYRLAVPAGQYTVSAWSETHLRQQYPARPCPPGCSGGTLVDVASDRATSPIDFALEPGGSISGSLTDGLRSLIGTVSVFNAAGVRLATAYSSYSGYATPLMPYGTYRLVAHVNGYASQAYPAIACPAEGNCALLGAPIELSAAQPDFSAAFAMQRPPGGLIVFRALDAESGAGLERVTFDDPEWAGLPQGWFLPRLVRDGVFVPYDEFQCTLAGTEQRCRVPAGDYRLAVYALGYGDQRYPGIACEPVACAATSGDLVSVSVGSSLLAEFRLTRFGRIGGTVRDGAGTALASFEVEAVDSSGNAVTTMPSSYSFDASPGFVPVYGREFPPGSYYLRTGNDLGFTDVLHAGVPCPQRQCNALLGTPVLVRAHARTVIDFDVGRSEFLLRNGFE